MQGREDGAGGVGVAGSVLGLGPAAVGLLGGEELPGLGLKGGGTGLKQAQGAEAVNAVLGVGGGGVQQPLFGGVGAGVDAQGKFGFAVLAQGAEDEVGGGEMAADRGRTAHGRGPVIEVFAVAEEVVRGGRGDGVRGPAGGVEDPERVARAVGGAGDGPAVFEAGSVFEQAEVGAGELVFEIAGVDGETTSPGVVDDQRRVRTVMTGEARTFLKGEGGAAFDERKRAGNGGPQRLQGNAADLIRTDGNENLTEQQHQQDASQQAGAEWAEKLHQ